MTILFFCYPPLLLISLVISFFFPAMVTYCKKSVHSFLCLSPYFDHHDRHAKENYLNGNLAFKCHNPNPTCTAGGLGFTGNAATGGRDGAQKAANHIVTKIVESTTDNSSTSSPSTLTMGIGFFDDIGRSVDGLMSCTESLGFESSDERRLVDYQIADISMSKSTREEYCRDVYDWKRSRVGEGRSRWKNVGEEVKKFPPPLSSLNVHGQPSFFLHPVRKDGRLQLTEVRIQRMEVLRASRQDGRLRLHLFRDEDAQDFLHQQHEEREHQQVEAGQERIEQSKRGQEEEIIEQEKENEEEKKPIRVVVEEEKEEQEQCQEEAEDDDEVMKVEVNEQAVRRLEEWKLPVSISEGFSRCYEVVNHHHHRHDNPFLVWRQHCVTTG